MRDLGDLTPEDFEAAADTPFVIPVENLGDLDLRLVGVARQPEQPDGPGRRRGFSVEFLGPLEYPVEQGMFLVRHPDMGDLELFIVPIGRGPDGFRYEAVFG